MSTKQILIISTSVLMLVLSTSAASYLSGYNDGWKQSKDDSYAQEVCTKTGCEFRHNGKRVP